MSSILTTRYLLPVAGALAALATPAAATLPEPVLAMVKAAIASGDSAKVDAVISIAKTTNPDDAAELDAMQAEFAAGQARLAADAKAEKEHKIRTAGLLENWHGSGELGASRTTGNTSNLGISVGLSLQRNGIDWTHKITASADFQRTNGVTTSEQFSFAYQPRYKLSDRFYTYALGRWERDRFQGYSSRISLSGGFGYQVIKSAEMNLSVQAGPAWRRTSYIADGTSDYISATGSLDFDWQIASNIALTQGVSLFADRGSTTVTSETALEAAINGSLKTRFSYQVQYDSGAPMGAYKTDTLTRMSLVYGF